MKVVGLTGGIGTGKSTVSAYLKEKGCFIIDTDEMSRSMTKKGSPVLKDIRREFGDEYFTDEGELDRKSLASLVFANPEKKAILEDLITKKVIEESNYIIMQLRAAGYSGVVVVDAPLLFECRVNESMDENWLVTCDSEVRINRVMERDSATREQVISRINNQMPEEEKIKLADRLIDNSKGLEELYKEIDEILDEIQIGRDIYLDESEEFI